MINFQATKNPYYNLWECDIYQIMISSHSEWETVKYFSLYVKRKVKGKFSTCVTCFIYWYILSLI